MAARRSEENSAIVRVVGLQSGHVIRGTALPGAEIDAVNLSASAAEPTGFHDSVTIARADARGRFVGKLPMREGDLLRVRARGPRGPAGRWIAVRASGLGGATRPLEVALFRFGLRDLGKGAIHLFNLSPSRPIAHPGATLTIANTRTGDRVDVVLNENGTFARPPSIPGRGGDVLSVEVAAEGRRVVGSLMTPAPSRSAPRPADRVAPSGYHQRMGFTPDVKRFRTALFAKHPRPNDVFQGELTNCHIASAAAALAHARPDLLERAIVRVGEGRYRVRFHASARPTRTTHRDVEVTADLFVRPSGELLYGSSTALDRAPVLWWPILEKAFARLKGSYKAIGEGGCADIVLRTLLGRPARRFFIDEKAAGEAERIWDEIRRAIAGRVPVVAGTSSFSPRKYRNTGLVPNHAYSVLSCRENRKGRAIGVRNPWGENATAPCKTRRSGFVELDLHEFIHLFCVISTVR